MKVKNIAIYLRLSLADKDLGENGKDESNSIENQRLLIRSYLTAHPELLGEVVEYKDDGFTGLNFNRPAFRQMIDDAKKGYVGTIIVKDLSRFGRDYIGMGDYLEQILPSLNVRLIAINSRYDSAEQGANIVNLDVSISNMIINMYSRDISKKIRSSFVAKWNQGINASASVPYGYVVRKDDPTHTPIIDEEAAAVVREIFQLAIAGYNSKDIAEHLNAKKVLIPMLYNYRKFGRKMSNVVGPEAELLWNTHTVLSIIKRYDYTGARTHGKREHIGVGLGKTKEKDRHEWIVVENNHEPIVSKEDFEMAQLIIKSPGFRTKCKNKNDDLLAGRVRCGCCGHVLQFFGDKNLYCQHAEDVGSKSNCNREIYDALKIRSIILYSLRKQLDLMAEINSALKERTQSAIPDEKAVLGRMKRRIEKLNEEFVRQYENYVNGNLQRDRFKTLKEEITAERSRLESQITEIEKHRAEDDRMAFEVERVVSIGSGLKKYKITREVLDALVEDIRISSSGKIEIKYKFEDLYAEALHELQSTER